jgi:hypothetical protein
MTNFRKTVTGHDKFQKKPSPAMTNLKIPPHCLLPYLYFFALFHALVCEVTRTTRATMHWGWEL